MKLPSQLINLPDGTVPRPDVEVKSYRSCQGMEGEAFSCKLYIDGVYAADVQDDGWGGETMFHWHDPAAKQTWENFVNGLPNCESEFDDLGSFPYSNGIVIGSFIDAVQSLKWLKRNCKNKLVFKLKTDPFGDFRWFAMGPHPATHKFAIARAQAVQKYGDQIEFFGNDIV